MWEKKLLIYIPRALNTGTCIQQGDLFYSAGQQEKIGRGFGKSAGEWTGRVEISKEIPGSKRSMYGYILTYCWKKRIPLKIRILSSFVQ